MGCGWVRIGIWGNPNSFGEELVGEDGRTVVDGWRVFSRGLHFGMNIILGLETAFDSHSTVEDWYLALMTPLGVLVQATVIAMVVTVTQRMYELEDEHIHRMDVTRQAVQTLGLPQSVHQSAFPRSCS